MLSFGWPWAFALLPLPLLIWRFAPPALAAEEAALWVPQLSRFGIAQHQLSRTNRTRAAKLLALLCWLLLICACARPQWLGDPIDFPVSGRDLLLAVDISGSMQTADFVISGKQVERLTALKYLAIPFIERRSGDRIGLLLFADQAYVQTPLTFDLKTVQTLLGEAMIGMAGQQTAIGDAIGLALKRTEQDDATSQVLILMTDGANTAGELTPLKAAELAASAGLKIYTIGIGADQMEVGGFLFSQTINPSQDLDEDTLTEIATTTGGRYFRARDSEDLEQIYALLDELEPTEKDSERFRPVNEMFFWPLGFAVCAAGLLTAAELLGPLRRRR